MGIQWNHMNFMTCRLLIYMRWHVGNIACSYECLFFQHNFTFRYCSTNIISLGKSMVSQLRNKSYNRARSKWPVNSWGGTTATELPLAVDGVQSVSVKSTTKRLKRKAQLIVEKPAGRTVNVVAIARQVCVQWRGYRRNHGGPRERHPQKKDVEFVCRVEGVRTLFRAVENTVGVRRLDVTLIKYNWHWREGGR